MSNRYEHLHYCEYRDTETGLVASNYVEVMNEQDQKIKELEHRLANCIEPKFKIGQEVWFVKYFNAGCYEFAYGKVVEIKITEYDGVFYEMEFRNNCEIDFKSRHEKYVFATEEEAKAKLEELKK